jgi:uncharacterized protein YndB with AHSA1/START domain
LTTKSALARATVTTTGDREIHIERVFNAGRDRVWAALTERDLIAQWWGRGNQLDIERWEFEVGGHWRFVENHDEGSEGFEGRFREIVAPERLVYTFEWDGTPAYVSIDIITLEDLGDGRTKLVTHSQFHTPEERDAMIASGMEDGLNESYAALDALLARTH